MLRTKLNFSENEIHSITARSMSRKFRFQNFDSVILFINVTWCRECLQQARPHVSDRNIKWKADLVERELEREVEREVERKVEREVGREAMYSSVRALPVMVVDTAGTVTETDDEYQC